MDSVLGSVGNLRARQCTLTCYADWMAVSLAVHHHIIDHSYYILVKMFVVWGVFISFVSFVLFLFLYTHLGPSLRPFSNVSSGGWGGVKGGEDAYKISEAY